MEDPNLKIKEIDESIAKLKKLTPTSAEKIIIDSTLRILTAIKSKMRNI